MNVRWFWSRPVKQPIVGKKALVLACRTPEPLALGDICCRCAKPNGVLRSPRVVETKESALVVGAEVLTGAAGHLIAGVSLLTQQKVKVPCCSSCRKLHRWGIVAGIAIILAGAGIFVGFASMDAAAKQAQSVWVDFSVIVGGFALVIVGGVVSAWFDWVSAGVLVYGVGGEVHYEFWSPKYHEYLRVASPRKGEGLLSVHFPSR